MVGGQLQKNHFNSLAVDSRTVSIREAIEIDGFPTFLVIVWFCLHQLSKILTDKWIWALFSDILHVLCKHLTNRKSSKAENPTKD